MPFDGPSHDVVRVGFLLMARVAISRALLSGRTVPRVLCYLATPLSLYSIRAFREERFA